MSEVVSTVKAKRLRFTYNDDVLFLREVVTENPFRDPSTWENVQKNLEIATGKVFTLKTLKNHLEILLQIFLKEDKIDMIRSGVEEPYCEKKHLLQEMAIICSEYKENNLTKKRTLSKEKQISELGKRAREKYTSVFNENKAPSEIPIDIQNIDSLEGLETVQQQDIIIDTDHIYAVPNANIEQPETLEMIKTTLDVTSQGAPQAIGSATENRNIAEASTSALTPKKNLVLGPTRTRPRKEATLRKNSLAYLREKHENDRKVRENCY